MAQPEVHQFHVPVEAIAFLGAVALFLFILVIFYLYLNKKMCFSECGGFPCIETPAKKESKTTKLGSDGEPIIKKKKIKSFGSAYAYDEQETSSDSDDEVQKRYQRTMQRSPSVVNTSSAKSSRKDETDGINQEDETSKEKPKYGTFGDVDKNESDRNQVTVLSQTTPPPLLDVTCQSPNKAPPTIISITSLGSTESQNYLIDPASFQKSMLDLLNKQPADLTSDLEVDKELTSIHSQTQRPASMVSDTQTSPVPLQESTNQTTPSLHRRSHVVTQTNKPTTDSCDVQTSPVQVCDTIPTQTSPPQTSDNPSQTFYPELSSTAIQTSPIITTPLVTQTSPTPSPSLSNDQLDDSNTNLDEEFAEIFSANADVLVTMEDDAEDQTDSMEVTEMQADHAQTMETEIETPLRDETEAGVTEPETPQEGATIHITSLSLPSDSPADSPSFSSLSSDPCNDSKSQMSPTVLEGEQTPVLTSTPFPSQEMSSRPVADNLADISADSRLNDHSEDVALESGTAFRHGGAPLRGASSPEASTVGDSSEDGRMASRRDLDGSAQSTPTPSTPTHAVGAFENQGFSQEDLSSLPRSGKDVASMNSRTSSDQAIASGAGTSAGYRDDEHLFDVKDLLDREEPPLISKCGSLEVTFAYDAVRSRMNITVHGAREIPAKDRGGANHTQIRMMILPTKRQKHKTKIKMGENPEYNEEFVFSKVPLEDVNSMGLRFRLYGCERMRRERMIGESVVGFASLNLDDPTTHWLSLEPRSNLSGGDSKLDISSLSRSDSASSTQSMQHGGMPELLIGLAYNGTTGRMSVEVIKGSNFRNMAMQRAPDTYVKLTLMSPTGQEVARSKTSIRRGQPNPLYKETFMFQVALFQLPDVTLMVSVYNKRSMKRKEMIGWFSLGLNNSGEEELSHWNDMRESKGEQVCRWHVLLES